MLNNWRKHRADAGESFRVDPYSTGVLFRGWKAFETPGFALFTPKGYEPLVVQEPRTWLLRVGWMRHGRIDFREVPSAGAGARGMHRETRVRAEG